MILFIGEESLAVAGIKLCEKILVALAREAVGAFEYYVVVEYVAFALYQSERCRDLAVYALHLEAELVDAAVVEDVLVVYAVDDGYPVFAEHHEVGVHHHAPSERHFIPRARLFAVAAVAFMLELETQAPYEAVFDEPWLCQTDTGIEVEIGHRHGVFKNVPEYLLCVVQI